MDKRRRAAKTYLSLALGALLLSSIGFFLLFLSRHWTDELQSHTIATPSMLVLGLLMGLGLYLLGLRKNGKALELLPMLVLGGVILLISREPVFWGSYPIDRSYLSRSMQLSTVEAAFLGLTLCCFVDSLLHPDKRRGFDWKHALKPLSVMVVVVVLTVLQKNVVTMAVPMHLAAFLPQLLVALLSLISALLISNVCHNPGPAGAWTLTVLGLIGLFLYVYCSYFHGLSHALIVGGQPYSILAMLRSTVVFGPAHADALTLYLAWLLIGIRGLLSKEEKPHVSA